MNSHEKGDDPSLEAKAAAAEHIALEASRLARIANANQFDLLAYLIDMVVLEAWREASESGSNSAVRKGSALANS